MLASKPIEIATVAAAGAFVAPTLVDGKVPSGRVPEPNLYYPDEFEIEFVATSGAPVIAVPVIVDCWKLDVATNTDVVFDQLDLSPNDIDVSVRSDVKPPIFVAGGCRAVSLRSGTVTGGNVQARVVWRSRVS